MIEGKEVVGRLHETVFLPMLNFVSMEGLGCKQERFPIRFVRINRFIRVPVKLPFLCVRLLGTYFHTFIVYMYTSFMHSNMGERPDADASAAFIGL
jgi:hypothetical protein